MKKSAAGWGIFAAALLISAIVLSLPMAASVLYLAGSANGACASEAPDPYLPQPEDDLVVLLAGYEQGKAPHTMLLAKFAPSEGKIIVAPLPAELMVEDSGRFDSAANVWKKGGPKRAVSAIRNTLGIKIDRYAGVELDGFIKIADTVGTVSYRIAFPIAYDNGAVVLREGEQLLDGRKLAALLSYRAYPGGEAERLGMLGTLAVEAINQRLPTLSPPMMELTFKTAVNSCETDISSFDYEARKKALAYLVSIPSPASALVLSGSYNDAKNTFIPTPESAKLLTLQFGCDDGQGGQSAGGSASSSSSARE